MLRLEERDFETHGYQEQLLRERDPEFERLFGEYRKQFQLA